MTDGLQIGNQRYQLGIRVLGWIVIIQSRHIRKDDQQIRIGPAGDDGRECIVISEPDLLRTDSIILVEDRDHTMLQKRIDGVVEVDCTLPVRIRVHGHEDLTDDHAVSAEALPPLLHQYALADGSRCLAYGNLIGLRDHTHGLQTYGYSTGRNQEHLLAPVLQLTDLLCHRIHEITGYPGTGAHDG